MTKSPKKKSPQKKKSPSELDRNKFQIVVEQNATPVDEFLEKVKNGIIKENEWVFTLDQVQTICDRVAVGFFYITRKMGNPKGKWAGEYMRDQINKIIRDAFT